MRRRSKQIVHYGGVSHADADAGRTKCEHTTRALIGPQHQRFGRGLHRIQHGSIAQVRVTCCLQRRRR
jgi:hypothetical protein